MKRKTSILFIVYLKNKEQVMNNKTLILFHRFNCFPDLTSINLSFNIKYSAVIVQYNVFIFDEKQKFTNKSYKYLFIIA